MGSFIVKPVSEEDFYVVYSTIVDSVTWFGSREELSGELSYEEGRAERFDRADEYGSSDLVGFYTWDRTDFVIREGIWNTPGWAVWLEINRSELKEFCETLQEDGYFHVEGTKFEDRWVTPEDLE